MKKHNFLYIATALIFILFLTSCGYEDKTNDYSNEDNNVENPDDYEIREIDLGYNYEKSEIYFSNPGANSFVIEVDSIFDESKLTWSTFGVEYEYDCGDKPFEVNVKAYRDGVLFGEAKKTFYPLIIKNFNLDKETCVATFDKVELAEYYDVYLNDKKYMSIYEESIDLKDQIYNKLSFDLKILPVSSLEGAVPVGIEKEYDRESGPNAFTYNGHLNRFEWNHDEGSGAKYELNIDGETVIVENVGYYDYVATKPITATIKKFAITKYFDSVEYKVEIVKDESVITSFKYDNENKKISWDKIESENFIYAYFIRIIENGNVRVYKTEENYLSLSGLSLDDFIVEIIPDRHLNNTIYNSSIYNINIYNEVIFDNIYNQETNENIINITSEEKAICGYNISIIKDETEVFNRYYVCDGELSFDDYQFLEEGNYELICTPTYIEDVKINVIEHENYKLVLSRMNKLTNHSYSYVRHTIVFPECEKIYYVCNGVEYHASDNKHFAINDNKTNKDQEKKISYYSDYYFLKDEGKVMLPSCEPLEISYSVLAPVTNVRAVYDKIEWDYEGDKTTFAVTVGTKTYYTTDKYYIPNIEDLKSYTFYISPACENSAYDISPKSESISVIKLQSTDISNVELSDGELVVSVDPVERARGYEFIVDDITYTSTTPECKLPYAGGTTLKVRAIGNTTILSSGFSETYNLHCLDNLAEVVNSNKKKTISIKGLEPYSDICKFSCVISSAGIEYYRKGYIEDFIDVSDLECRAYSLDVSASPIISGHDIYFGGSILHYSFKVIDFGVETSQFGFKNVYYPSSIQASTIHDYMSFRLETHVSGMKSDYYLDYKDEVMPDLKGIYDDYSLTVMFDFIDTTPDEYYEMLNVFSKRETFTKGYYIEELSEKGKLTYVINHSDQICLNIHNIDNKKITYTVTKDGVDFMNSTNTVIVLDAPYEKTVYDVVVKSQIVSDTFYVGTTMSQYTVSNKAFNTTKDYTSAPSLAKSEIYTVTYEVGWKFTGNGMYNIDLTKFVIEHPYSDDLIYYAYAHLYVEQPNGDVLDKGRFTDLYSRYGTFNFGELYLSEGAKLTFEIFISPDGYKIPSKVITLEYYAIA